MDVKGAPGCRQVFEDLVGGDIAIGRMVMLELGVVLLVKGITEVCGDSLEETFPNVPIGTGALPLLV